MKNGTRMIQCGYDESGLRTRKYANGTYTFLTGMPREIWCMRHGTTERNICITIMMLVAASVPSATTGHGMLSARICRGTLSPFWIPTAILWPGIPTTPEAESCQSPMVTATSTHPLPSLVTSTPCATVGITMILRRVGITLTLDIMIPQ